ncbi:hypothetical protein CIB84_000910, partial [Bambusicola thoracicus]
AFFFSKVGHPHPGEPYKGGCFLAFLPDNREGQKTAILLKKAFEQGLTFQVKSCNGEERVTWGPIPHKTSWHGGKARYDPVSITPSGFSQQLQTEKHWSQCSRPWNGCYCRLPQRRSWCHPLLPFPGQLRCGRPAMVHFKWDKALTHPHL